MKALISPNETSTVKWITSWKLENNQWVPDTYGSVDNCQRIVEVEQETFLVAPPMYWVDCPDDCRPDIWYHHEGQVYLKPQSVPPPEDDLAENQGE
jgi:hypothetical protein